MPQLHMPRQTRAPQQVAAVSIFVPLAITAVCLRIWIRRKMIKSLGVDDIMMLVALGNFLLYSSSIIIVVINGGGTHLKKFELLKIAISWTLVAEVFYLITIIFLKLSLGLFFLRVLLRRWQRNVVYVAMVSSVIINTFHCFFVVFSCGNPKYYLENTVRKQCVGKRIEVGLAYEQAAVTTITDFVFALLPVPLLWSATMDRRSKLSVGLILSLGAFGSICSLVRFKYVDSLADRDDFFWNAASVSVWSTSEMGTGIVAGCLATMRPLFQKLFYRAVHVTNAAGRQRRPSTSKSSMRVRMLKGRYSSSTSHSTSNKSFQDWKQSVDRSTSIYTTTCVGGPDLDLETADDYDHANRIQLAQIEEESSFPQDMWTNENDKARIWPYGDGISKVVDVKISVSRGQPMNGFWDNNGNDAIQVPEKARKNSRDDNSIPEWDRLPDLFLANQQVASSARSVRSQWSRKGSRDEDIPEWDKLPDLILPGRPGTGSERSTRSGSGSPTLIRVTSK